MNSVHSFGLFPRAPQFLPQRIAGSSYEIDVLKENNYPKRFLYDCLRHPALTDCNSPEGDSATKGFANQSGEFLIIVVSRLP